MQPPTNAVSVPTEAIVPLMGTLGTRLRAARTALKLTQAELGERIGFTSQFISQVEADKKEPGREFLIALHTQIGLSLDLLLFGTTTPLPEHDANVTISSQSRRGFAVPLLSVREAIDPDIDLSNREMVSVFFRVGKRSCAVSIRDDSNDTALAKGDLAIFDPDVTLEPGSIVLARYRMRDAVIGRLRYEASAAGTVTVVQPVNAAWPAARSDLGELVVIATLAASQRQHKS